MTRPAPVRCRVPRAGSKGKTQEPSPSHPYLFYNAPTSERLLYLTVFQNRGTPVFYHFPIAGRLPHFTVFDKRGSGTPSVLYRVPRSGPETALHFTVLQERACGRTLPLPRTIKHRCRTNCRGKTIRCPRFAFFKGTTFRTHPFARPLTTIAQRPQIGRGCLQSGVSGWHVATPPAVGPELAQTKNGPECVALSWQN